LILYRHYATDCGRIFGRRFDVVGCGDHTAQGHRPVVGVDLDRIALRNSIFRERAFDLSD
jgi:hypothetical protein